MAIIPAYAMGVNRVAKCLPSLTMGCLFPAWRASAVSGHQEGKGGTAAHIEYARRQAGVEFLKWGGGGDDGG